MKLYFSSLRFQALINYSIFLLLPIYLIKISITAEISVNLLEVLVLIATISNFYQSIEKLKESSILQIKLFLPVLLIMFGFTISFFYGQHLNNWHNWSDSLGKFVDMVLLPIVYALSLYPFFRNNAFKINEFQPLGLLFSYFISTLTLSLLGLILLISHDLTFDNRLTVFFQSPNEYAFFLAPAIIIISNWLLPKFHYNIFTLVSRYWLLLIASLILIINFYFTYSLGAWLTIILVIVTTLPYYKIINNQKITAWIKKCFLKLLFVVIILFVPIILNIDFILPSHTNHQSPNSYDSRLVIYQVDKKIISKYWLAGIGPGNYQNIYLKFQKYFKPYPQWAVPHAHNNLIHFWIEGGLLAIIGLALLYKNIIYTTTLPRLNKLPAVKQPIVLMFLLYFMLHGLIDVTIWTPFTAIIFWVLVFYYLKD